MKLEYLPLDQLKPSPLNVRKKGGKDVGDLIASIRSLGLLQPLLVRKNCEGFDIIAGKRRYNAVAALASEGNAEPVPCFIMEEGDDAKALEASLAENIARLPMDEIDQYKAFAALREEGRDVADIAARFGVTERLVEQRLAIANIITPILNAYRREEVDAGTLRILTMATPRQQKAWWKLFRSADEYAPTGRTLRHWLLGGSQVPVLNALFNLQDYEGGIVSDLFGEDRYFADSDKFWSYQNAAIAAAKQRYLDAGWSEVVVLDIGEHFASWNHVKTPKKKGSKVFVSITRDGEVTFHEGYLSHKEAQRKAKANGADEDISPEPAKPERAELTKAMQNYVGLHKHAAVRGELLKHPKLALRLALAHMIAGSSLWRVEAESQRSDSEAIAASLSSAKAQPDFSAERQHIYYLLGLDGEDDTAPLTRSRYGASQSFEVGELFYTLTILDDEQVLRVLAYVMAETLAAHEPVVDTLGRFLDVDMRNWWSPDTTFFDLLRDKQAINAMLRDVAGDVTADAHVASTAKVQKKIIADCLSRNGSTKVENWLPRYMQFPGGGYTERCASTVTAPQSEAEDTEASE